MECRLVLFDDEQVVPTGVEHLLAERALAEERITCQDTPVPVHAGEECWGGGEFRLSLIGLLVVIDGFVGQDDPVLLQASAPGMPGTARRRPGPPPALRL